MPVADDGQGTLRYRPRTEGIFAWIEHVRGAADDYWRVRGRDGLTTWYGTPRPPGAGLDWADPAVVRNRRRASRPILAWKPSETADSFGNLIRYRYGQRDAGRGGPHDWDQPLLTEIAYADYGDPISPRFLVRVLFEYEPRPDPWSDYRAGFEVRTTRRCRRILVQTEADQVRPVRELRLEYEADPTNGVSLLRRIVTRGFDDVGQPGEELPPLELAYTTFRPAGRRFAAVEGAELPERPLGSPERELVDLFGAGLPDLLELNGTARYWRNLGGGRFDRPRELREAPADLGLADRGVQLLDANGDGRADLLVTTSGLAGYFPLRFGGGWDRRSFRAYRQAPSFDLDDPEVRLVDLDGDGVVDAVRNGARLECFFNDPRLGWQEALQVERSTLAGLPDLSFADPRVRWADLNGDGLDDLALVHDGNVEYWPSLGRGDFGRRVHLRGGPRLPAGFDPRRVLLGDVDGDGLADLVYVHDGRVLLWINRGGEAWSEPIVIQGTPPLAEAGSVRLVDLHGTGVAGLLWSTNVAGSRRNLWFLDFTGGVKPYLLERVDNHLGAETRVEYAPSTHFYLADQPDPKTRWRTPLPFPVQVVRRVEAVDRISRGRLTSEYRYHHGYWDGAEREFRGFGMVEQFDTQTFEAAEPAEDWESVDPRHRSPPILTKTWFHQGAVGDEEDGWRERDFTGEYWPGDGQILSHADGVDSFLAGFPATPDSGQAKRDALRSLRGSLLRTELYVLDGSPAQDRPYTVTEQTYGLALVAENGERAALRDRPRPADLARPAGDRRPRAVFFPHQRGQRTTRWERGDDPLTRFSFADEYDPHGQPRRQAEVACPRGWRPGASTTGYLATRALTVYAEPAPGGPRLFDRVARRTAFELRPSAPLTVEQLMLLPDGDPSLSPIGQEFHHYDGSAFEGLPNGQVGPHGALVRTERLVLTEAILQAAYGAERPAWLTDPGPAYWPAEYPPSFRDSLPPRGGYRFYPADGLYLGGYYAAVGRRCYDFHAANGTSRGLLTGVRPPLGRGNERDTRIAYDAYDLLPAEVTDPLGLATRAEYDYRVLKPGLVEDVNGNRTRYRYSSHGLLEAAWLTGKAGEGDQAQPGTTLRYDFRAYLERGQPIFVHATRRTYHDADAEAPPDRRDDVIETREYSDGFGRLLQTRALAEDLLFGDEQFGEALIPAEQTGTPGPILGRRRADDDPPNVVVSGWQVYDNKGRVVEKYEPFFARGWDYSPPTLAQRGARAIVAYDPLGRVVRTVNPDGSEQRVVLGVPDDLAQPGAFRPTPWATTTYDAADNAGRAPDAPPGTPAHHHDTPTSLTVDALGRVVETVERNRDGPGAPLVEIPTRQTYDIRGNLLEIADALGRSAYRYTYDLADNRLCLDSIDAGLRRTALDAAGQIVEQRDGRGALVLRDYDPTGRPAALWARDGAVESVTLRERREYGDGGRPDQPPAERQAARAANRLGRPYQQYDEAGLLVGETYDFKGNPLEKVRRVIADTALVPGWRADWAAPGAEATLDPTEYRVSTAFDALNRARLIRYPQHAGGPRRELTPEYNRAGLLCSVALGGQVFVREVAYNARGQRTLVVYANGLLTASAHDPRNFRLRRLWTGAYATPAGGAPAFLPRADESALQDLRQDFDLLGNVLAIHDRAPGCGLSATPDALDRAFSYDALSRLRSASGRECAVPPPAPPWEDPPRCQDLTQARAYAEAYAYDAVGNLVQVRHTATGGSFTRDQTPEVGSNRLAEVRVGPTPYSYQYDANGNLTREATSRHFDWDHADRLVRYRTQAGPGPASVDAVYLYDAAGQRVKKLVRKQGGQVETTIYLDGIFEQHARGGVTNATLHVLDGQNRLAEVRLGAAFPGDGLADAPVRYHLGDHLGSSQVVVGGATAAARGSINREEYLPYGETSFGSYARKRYRFGGKERDEESGLAYFGARSYAPWLGRWLSCDPAGPRDGPCLYAYVRGNPVRFRDPRGLRAENDMPDYPAMAPARAYSAKEATPSAPPAPSARGGSPWPPDPKVDDARPSGDTETASGGPRLAGASPSGRAAMVEVARPDRTVGEPGKRETFFGFDEGPKPGQEKSPGKGWMFGFGLLGAMLAMVELGAPAIPTPAPIPPFSPPSPPPPPPPPPGNWTNVARRDGPWLELQSMFSGQPINYDPKTGLAYIREYQLDGVLFDRLKDGALGEIKGDYSFMNRLGYEALQERVDSLVREAQSQAEVAARHHLRLEWYVRQSDLPAFQHSVGSKVPQIHFVPY